MHESTRLFGMLNDKNHCFLLLTIKIEGINSAAV